MTDLKDLENSLKKLEKFPTRFLTQAVKKYAAPILLQTQIAAPIGETGNLLRALELKQEKAKPGKRVMQITYSAAYNDKLVKISKLGKRSYYPASQEFGFKLRNGQKKEGQHFMKKVADQNARPFEAGVIDFMMNKIEAEWRK